MSETGTPHKPIDIPEDVHEEITKTIRQAFQLFADHNKQMSEDLVAFNKKQAEVRERLKSGAN